MIVVAPGMQALARDRSNGPTKGGGQKKPFAALLGGLQLQHGVHRDELLLFITFCTVKISHISDRKVSRACLYLIKGRTVASR